MPDPSPWVVKWAPLIPVGAVLDLACGRGRHSRYLAALGYQVTAVDRDKDALALLGAVTGVSVLAADLENGSPWPLPGRQFEGIVVTNYLHRPLFPDIVQALAPGGVLIYETFALGNERHGKPSNPGFLLRSGELYEAFHGVLSVVAFEQGTVDAPRPAVIQRLCAVRAELHAARLPGGS